MKDHALASLIRTILGMKTKGEAVAHAQNVGADYADLINALVARLTFKRTLSQNAIFHVWMDEIAKHLGDRTASEVKGECHHRWGLPIRLRDEQFAYVWNRGAAHLNYEQKCSFLASGVLSVSSKMSVKELNEYLSEIERHYTPKGVRLTERESG